MGFDVSSSARVVPEGNRLGPEWVWGCRLASDKAPVGEVAAGADADDDSRIPVARGV